MRSDPRRAGTPVGAALVVSVLIASAAATAIGAGSGLISLSRVVGGTPSGPAIGYLAVATVLLLGGLAGFAYVLRLYLAGPFDPPEE